MTNKPLTPQEIIERLAEEFDCQMHYACNHLSHLKPIYIGDVLEKIINEMGLLRLEGVRLTLVWEPLGFNKSLQEIEEEGGPQARELFNFLAEIYE